MILSDRFDDAFLFASDLHRGQSRKTTGVPYLTHLMAVAALVIEHGGSEEEGIAALLHDALEDQGQWFPGGREALRLKIAARFGNRVLQMVEACTDQGHVRGGADSLETERIAWRRRKEASLARLRILRDHGARRVACADKLHNARCLLEGYRAAGDLVWQLFRTRSAQDQLWYYRAVADVLRETGGGALVEELARVIGELESMYDKRV